MALANPQQHFSPQEWSAYIDGELAPATREAMRAHLQQCAACADIVRSLDAVQRGAAELARQAEPPAAWLRSRLLAVGVATLRRDKSRLLWSLALGAFVAVVVLAVVVRTTTRPVSLPTAPSPAVSVAAVQVTLDQVHITKLLVYPPSLDYEITVRNSTNAPLLITRVMISDPLGEIQRTVEPPREVAAGESVQWVFGRLVREDTVLPAGRYRIALITENGSLTAETILSVPKNP
jgi:hypothetical protein